MRQQSHPLLLHHPCLALVVLQPLGTDNSWREEDKEQGWELGTRTWLRVYEEETAGDRGAVLGRMEVGLEAGVC